MALSTLPNNPMNFTENQHGNVILEKLKQQKEQGRFCDVTLYIEGKKYKAHRNVLASCSPYFDSVLKMHKTVKEGLTITCQNPEVFHCLLNYMYTGSIVIDKNNVAELLRLSNHFLVAKLRNYCAEYLDRYLDITNCLSVRDMAEKYNMPSLMKAATLFIQVNMTKIIFQDEILACPLRKIEAFLSEKSWSVPHSMLLGLISRWVSRDVSVRERSMRALLTFMDWHAVDGNAVTDHIDHEPLYSTSEVSLYFILQSLVENNLLFSKYQGIYQALQEKFSQENHNLEYTPVQSDTQNTRATDTYAKGEMDKYMQHNMTQLNGSPLDNDSFLNMAVSTAIEGLQEATSEDPSVLHQSPDKTKQQGASDKCCQLQKTSTPVNSKLVLSRSRRAKQKVYGLRPGARLAALKAALSARRKRLKKGTKSQNSEPLGLTCYLCSHVAQDSAQLEKHLAVSHCKDVTYKCGLCGFMCQWNKDYFSHMKQHFQGPPFKCELCKFTCDRITLLLAHRLKHSNERFYRCEECGFRCKTRADMVIHKRCHSNVRQPHNNKMCDVYRCSYPQCKYSTQKKSQLGSHSRTHAGVRPHCCGICGRGFLEKSHLVRHERIHLEDKPFKCSQCDYASSRRDKLKEHFGRHHGEHASAKVPYKSRPTRGSSVARTTNKTCQENGSGFNTSSSSSNSSNASLERNANPPPVPVSTGGDLDLMMQHHISTPTTSNPSTAPQQPAYPGFTDSHHSSLEFHHHQLLNTARSTSKTDHHSIHHHQTPAHHPMLPPARSQHHQSSAAAVAAMMLDPRFHHSNAGATYPAPPVSMAAMAAQGGATQSQSIAGQHQGEYPCMPLF